MSTTAIAASALGAFVNEPVSNFTEPGAAAAVAKALAEARAKFGEQYELLVAGERVATGDLLRSLNPAHPSETVGLHHKAGADLANRAIEAAHAYFPEYAATPVEQRIEWASRVAGV